MTQIPRAPITIALVDPVWAGHHATYFRAFISAFQMGGARVLALCPNPADLADLVQEYPTTLRTATLETSDVSSLFRGRDHDPLTTHQRWCDVRDGVQNLENDSGWKASLIFFAWLDSYLRFMVSAGLTDRMIGRPWIGLYFRAQHLLKKRLSLKEQLRHRVRGDFVLRSRYCKGIASVDESLVAPLAVYSGKPVFRFPDITDETPGDPNHPLAVKIRERAKGRKVIGMVGLEKRKGFLTLLRVSKMAEEAGKPWFFAFTGVLFWETLDRTDAGWLSHLLSEKPENVYINPEAGPIPDGAAYNGVAGTFDLFYAAYLNSLYSGSSNVLTKAALLEIPVIVTKGACLEERAREYHLGLAIDEDSALEAFNAIEQILAGEPWQGQYAEYFALHSHDCLAKSMKEILELVASTSPGAQREQNAILQLG